MKTRKFNSVTTIAVSLIALLGVVIPACSSDDSDDDSTNIGGDASADAGGSSGNGGSGNTSGDDDSGVNNGGTDSGALNPDGGGGTDQTDGGGDGGPIDQCSADPLGEDGCFNCPTNSDEFLNRCTSSDCEPFDNATRLPHLNNDGTLPPLP